MNYTLGVVLIGLSLTFSGFSLGISFVAAWNEHEHIVCEVRK